MLKQVPGVADVVTFGGYLKEVHVASYPDRLRAHGLTLTEVGDALAKTNINVGGGFVRHGDQELTVRGIGYIGSVEDIRPHVLKSARRHPGHGRRHRRDRAVEHPAARRRRLERAEGGGRGLRPHAPRREPVARPGRTCTPRSRSSTAKILPKGMQIEPFYDRTLLVGNTLHTVNTQPAASASCWWSAVAWLFFRSLTGSLIVAAVIPLALLGAFIGLYVLGMPANLISMGAIDFGILVDGAVVLVENVLHSRSTSGRRRGARCCASSSARPRRWRGRRSSRCSIIIAALVPVFTLQQVEGRIFRPLALTYSFALVGGAGALRSRWCRRYARSASSAAGRAREPRWIEKARGALPRLARPPVRRAARRSLAVAAAFAACASIVLGRRLGTEFLPELDEGDFVVFVEMPPQHRARARRRPCWSRCASACSRSPRSLRCCRRTDAPRTAPTTRASNMSETFVRLQAARGMAHGLRQGPPHRRDARARSTEIPGVRYNFSQPIKDNVEEAVAGVRGKVVLKIFGTDLEADARHAGAGAPAARARCRASSTSASTATPPCRSCRSSSTARRSRAPASRSTTRERLRRHRARRQGGHHLLGRRAAGAGAPASCRSRRARTQLAIGELAVPRPGGGSVPLRELAQIAVAAGAANIYREANSRYLALKFNVEGRDMGSVVTDAHRTVVSASVKVPEGYYFVWGGEFENQQRAIARLRDHRAGRARRRARAALRRDPVGPRALAAILLAAPFALTGGVFALWARRHAALGERGRRLHRAARPGVARSACWW